MEYDSGEKEYYALAADPRQVDSAHAAPENAEQLGALSEVLAGCAGAGCRSADRDCSADQADNDGDGVVDESGETCGDPQPSDTTIDASPDGLTRDTSASFTFFSSEENSTFECSLDGASFAACNPENNTLNSKTYNNLDDGKHTFSVRAIDQGGLADPIPANRTWTVDTTAPTIESVRPVEGATDVSPMPSVRVLFSETMDESSVEATDPTTGNPTTFTLAEKTTTGTSAPIPATVTYVETATSHQAILDPTEYLRPGATYVATVKTAARDLAGNELDLDPNVSGEQRKTWKFTVS